MRLYRNSVIIVPTMNVSNSDSNFLFKSTSGGSNDAGSNVCNQRYVNETHIRSRNFDDNSDNDSNGSGNNSECNNESSNYKNRVSNQNDGPINYGSYGFNKTDGFHCLSNDEKKLKAENYKNAGNECFKKGFIEMAIIKYGEAIELNPTHHVYWTNRALCFKKLCLWEKVAADCREALNCEEESVKAHYLLGLALVYLGDATEGFKKLKKAKTLSSLNKSNYEDEIECAILKARKMMWEQNASMKLHKQQELKSFMMRVMDFLKSNGGIMADEYEQKKIELEELIDDASVPYTTFEIPDFLCCKISMDIMKDPVCTPSGQTYDRRLIEEHIKHNGAFDPISRQTCKLQQLVPNYAIKDATKYFIDKYPWLYTGD